jgi:hypothetical protein
VLPLSLALRRSWLDVVLVLWMIASAGAVSLSSGPHGHYFVFLYLPLALAAGSAIGWISGAATRRSSAWPASFLVPLLLTAAVFGNQSRELRTLASNARLADRHLRESELSSVAQRIRDETSPGERILVFGRPLSPVFLAGAIPAGRYIYWPVESLLPSPKEFMRAIQSARPRLAYIGHETGSALARRTPGVHGRLARHLEEHYELLYDAGFARLYLRRREEASTEHP